MATETSPQLLPTMPLPGLRESLGMEENEKSGSDGTGWAYNRYRQRNQKGDPGSWSTQKSIHPDDRRQTQLLVARTAKRKPWLTGGYSSCETFSFCFASPSRLQQLPSVSDQSTSVAWAVLNGTTTTQWTVAGARRCQLPEVVAAITYRFLC